MYKFELTDLQGNKLAELDKATSRKYSIVLNNAGSISFDYDGRDEKASLIKAGETEVHVYRDDKKMQAGQIRTVHKKVSADSNIVSVGAVGFLGLLEHRHLRENKIYSNTDQGQIAWGLINYTQALANGSFNITEGSNPASKNRDRTYDANKQIAEALKQLGDVEDSFDFEITPDKVFNSFYPMKGIQLTNFIFELGKNIKEIEEKQDASPGSFANFIICTGQDTAGNTITATAADAASIQQYGIREKVEATDIKEQATLQTRANELLDRYKQIPTIYELTVESGSDPELGSYEVGDWIRVRANDGCLQIDDKFLRLISYDVDIDDNNIESVKLSVAEKYQLPKSIFDIFKETERRLGNLER